MSSRKFVAIAFYYIFSSSVIVGATNIMPGDSTKKNDNRNIMLNAESATVAREINIGLPETGAGAVIYVDGTKHGQGLQRGQYHWAGGNAYEPIKSIGLMDAVITTGEIGILVDSRTKFGSDTFHGDISVGTSSNGLLNLDACGNGPISRDRNWYFSLGAYVNYDPTNVNAPSRPFVDQKQIYNLAISKRWRQGELNFIYRLSFCNDSADNGYGKAPFIYNGDGAISTYYGFRIGKDCYFPGNDMLTYMDVNSGRIISSQMSKLDNRHIQDYSITGRHKTYSGWEMFGSIHLCALYPTSSVRIAISGIDNAIVSSGYTKTNGDIFCGKIQNRFAEIDHVESYDLELLFRVEKQWNRHHLLLGTSLMYANQYQDASTAYFAHTVEPNPERIYKNGQESWNLNRSGQFFMGNRYSAAFFAIHDWNITNQFQARTGIRLTPAGFDIMSAAQMNGENINKRVEGFNISNPNLCSLHNIKKIGLDAAVSEHLSYGFAKGLFATADGFFSRVNKTTTYFKNQTIPSTKPIGYAFGSIGLKYEHPIIDCAAVVSYISSWNNAKLMSVSKQVSGHSETIPWTAEYGIGTLGCTVDANLHIRGFNLHALVTWQDPKYKNYYNEFVFSDNTRLVIDYSGKFVTGISRVIVEFDPSYSWKDYRIWASFRYYSRQYASRTNYAYFNGHIESFAGFDVSFNQRNKVSIRFVNILFQNGVKGSLDIADTIDDPGLLVNYLMAGSYIRPFTIELKYTFHF